MSFKHHLGVADFVVIAFSLLISALIGIYIQFFGKSQKTTEEYLMAGRGMSKFPVVISITVTMLSAFTMLSHPTEIYRFGLQRAFMIVSTIVGTYLASIIFIPVYFQTKVSTTNEYLEIRFGKKTRFIVSTLFNLNMGGLKAVLWTDVFQASFMFLCFIVIYIKGIQEAGGVAEIYNRSYEGGRLDLFNMSVDLTTRYTFLNVFIKGVVSALAYYGTSQIEVQRMLCTQDVSKAKSSLIWSIIPVTILLFFCYFLGLILYTVFYECDPVLNSNQTGITKYDQIVPYYIVSRLNSVPGLTGLCIAGIFSGSLSTISSALNSLSTVTIIDFIRPLISSPWLDERKTVYIAKGISVFYGILCILLAFAFSAADSLMQITTVLMSVTEGPVLAVYLVAMLTRRASEMSIVFGLLVGVLFSSWIGYGSVFNGTVSPSLPLNSKGCSNISYASKVITCQNDTVYSSQNALSENASSEIFFLYKISFTWFSTFGCLVTLICIVLSALVTGWNKNVIPADSLCLSPVAKIWMKKSILKGEVSEVDDQVELENKISSWSSKKNLSKYHDK